MNIYVFKKVTCDLTYTNVLYFKTPQARLNYLTNNYNYKLFSNGKFLDTSEVIVLSINAQIENGSNYICVDDENCLLNYRFYFINKIEQTTPANYLVTLLPDIFATYFDENLQFSKRNLLIQATSLLHPVSNVSLALNKMEALTIYGTNEFLRPASNNGAVIGIIEQVDAHNSGSVPIGLKNYITYLDSTNTIQNVVSAFSSEIISGVPNGTFKLKSIHYIPADLMASIEIDTNELNVKVIGDVEHNKPHCDAYPFTHALITSGREAIQPLIKGFTRIYANDGLQINIDTNLRQFDFEIKCICENGSIQIGYMINKEFNDFSTWFEIPVYTTAFNDYQAFNKATIEATNQTRKQNLILNATKIGASGLLMATGSLTSNPLAIAGGIATLSTSFDNSKLQQDARFKDLSSTPLELTNNTNGLIIYRNGLQIKMYNCSNNDDIEYFIKNYGYSFTSTEFEAPNNSRYDIFNYYYFKYEEFNIIKSPLPVEIEAFIVSLFKKGVRVWYKPAVYLESLTPLGNE